MRVIRAEPGQLEELVASYRRGEGLLLTHAHQHQQRPAVDVADGQIGVFTSGTTGPPRIVELSRQALETAAAACLARLGWSSGERWMLSLSWAHVGGLAVVVRCLVGDGVVVPGPAGPFEAAAAVDFLAAHAITRWSLVPTQLARLVRAGLAAPPSLRSVLLGGAAATPSLLAAAARLGWPVVPSYGLTETGGCVAATPAVAAVAANPAGTTGCGPALDGNEIRIDDGRIAIRGAQLFSRYLGQPPRVATDWFVTSDLGRLDDDGNLHVLGRADEVVITGGEKVWPGEVESVLHDQPGVRAAVVFGVPDAEWGQRLVAVVEGDRVDGARLRACLRDHLPPWKVPQAITVVPSLPTLPSGKIDRRRAAGVPSG